MQKLSLAAYIATILSKVATKVMVLFDDSKDTLDLPPPTPVIIIGQGKSDGTIVGPASDGKLAVTETSGAASSTYMANINAFAQIGQVGAIVGPYVTAANALNAQHRIGRAVITCDGAGAWANESLVPALAGYYGVMRLKSIKANAGVAAGILTFESPAATPALPSVEQQPALTANVRRDDTGVVVTHATLTDNQAIVVDGANFGAGTIVSLEWEYFYET